jgi:hypothetical protein
MECKILLLANCVLKRLIDEVTNNHLLLLKYCKFHNLFTHLHIHMDT